MSNSTDVVAPGAAFTEHHVEADGLRVRYLEAGTGDPLVFLHGGGGLVLHRSHDLLAEQFRLIAVEIPGFGGSENPGASCLADLAETIAAAATAIGLDTFHLWGTSFGGATSSWLAVRHPERIRHLVLEAPASFRAGSRRPDQLTPEQLGAALYAHPERQPWLRPPDPAGMAKNMAFMGRVFGPEHDHELEARFASLMTPTLVVLGTRDGLFDTSIGAIYARALPQVSVQHVYDAGHEIGADRPEAFADLVGDFLRRGLSFRITHRTTLLNP